MTALRLAWLSLTRRKVSSLIAVAAIAVSVACSGILYRLHQLSMSRFSSLAAGGEAIVGAKAGGLEILLGSLNLEGSYPGFLPYVLFRSLQQQQAVKFEDGAITHPTYLQGVIPFVYFGAFKNYRLIGTDDGFLKRPKLEDSLTVIKGEWVHSAGDVVLGAAVAEKESLHVGDTFQARPWTHGEFKVGGDPGSSPLPFKVVGILAPTEGAWDRGIYATLSTARQVLAKADLGEASIWSADVLNYFLIYFDLKGFESLSSLVNRRTVGQLISVEREKRRLEELTGTGHRLGLLMVGFILLLGALAVAGMLITRFEAMMVQLAVLRALGYKKREVAGWLLWEGVLLGLAACVVGGLMDAVFFPGLRALLHSALPDSVASSVWLSAPVWAVAMCATVAAVAIPVVRLYREDIHDALKGL